MPKLWDDTIEAHRRAVRDATLDTAAALVSEHGLGALTMSQIAEETGIGRATLYKYFPDVEAILIAWHERQIANHLEQLVSARDAAGPGARERLVAVLDTYARISHEHHGSELSAHLHRGQHIAQAERKLRTLLRDLLAEGARLGEVRSDVGVDELVSFCLRACGAASGLPSKSAVRRLVTVILAGLGTPNRARSTTRRRAASTSRRRQHPGR